MPTKVQTRQYNDGSVGKLALNNDTRNLDLSDLAFTGSPYNPVPGDLHLQVDSTGGGVIIDLPLLSTQDPGRPLFFKDVGGAAGTNPIQIRPSFGDLIDGSPDVLAINLDYGFVGLASTGTQWVILFGEGINLPAAFTTEALNVDGFSRWGNDTLLQQFITFSGEKSDYSTVASSDPQNVDGHSRWGNDPFVQVFIAFSGEEADYATVASSDAQNVDGHPRITGAIS